MDESGIRTRKKADAGVDPSVTSEGDAGEAAGAQGPVATSVTPLDEVGSAQLAAMWEQEEASADTGADARGDTVEIGQPGGSTAEDGPSLPTFGDAEVGVTPAAYAEADGGSGPVGGGGASEEGNAAVTEGVGEVVAPDETAAPVVVIEEEHPVPGGEGESAAAPAEAVASPAVDVESGEGPSAVPPVADVGAVDDAEATGPGAAWSEGPGWGLGDLEGMPALPFEASAPVAPVEGRWKLAGIAGGLLLAGVLLLGLWGGGGAVVAGLTVTPAVGASPTQAETATPAWTATPVWTPTLTSTPSRTGTPAPTLSPTRTGTPTTSPTITPTGPQQIGALWKQLDAAWIKPDWPAAIAILERVMAIDPAYPTATDKLFAAHYNYGVALVRSDQMGPAVAQFDAALALFPANANAKGERDFAQLYWDATRAYNLAEWTGAIEPLTTIYKGNPDYKKTRQLLYASYYNDGFYLEKAGKLDQAKARYVQALAVNPRGGEASVGLERVTALLKLPSPTPTRAPVAGKNIEVNLTTFRAIAWDGKDKVYDFLVGTGEPGRPTGTGDFTILDKIPSTYDATSALRMPFWMGIYWSDYSVENGFHGLPVNRSGQKMWGGYLGTRITWGCIVLSDADAETLYNWAEVGIPVWVHY